MKNLKSMPYDDIKALINDSPFKRRHYQVDFAINRFINCALSYTHGLDIGNQEPLSKIFEAVPPFQRDNDKWTESMQVSFIENLLMGYRTFLMFYEVGDKGMINCKLLDGLQRLTALYRFMTGEITAFGRTFDELWDAKVIYPNFTTISLRVYNFSSEHEAVQFYIKINENITHSRADIARAKKYLARLES